MLAIPRALAAPTSGPSSLPFRPTGPTSHPGNSFIIIEADRKIDRHSAMFIIISSDTTARSRCTSRRDGSSRLRWTHMHANGLIYTVTGARMHANPCVRKEESDRFDLDCFFFLPGYLPFPPILSSDSPFFRTAHQDHQSASRGLLRGYATRVCRREDRSGSLVRSLWRAR